MRTKKGNKRKQRKPNSRCEPLSSALHQSTWTYHLSQPIPNHLVSMPNRTQNQTKSRPAIKHNRLFGLCVEKDGSVRVRKSRCKVLDSQYHSGCNSTRQTERRCKSTLNQGLNDREQRRTNWTARVIIWLHQIKELKKKDWERWQKKLLGFRTLFWCPLYLFLGGHPEARWCGISSSQKTTGRRL